MGSLARKMMYGKMPIIARETKFTHEVRDEADVHEVKADDEEVIDAVREFGVAVKAFDEEHAAVLVQRAGDTHGHADREGEVEGVGEDGFVHSGCWFGLWTSQEVKVGAETAGRSRMGKGNALGPWREVFGKAHVPGKTDAAEESDEPPAGIMLALA